MKNKPIFLLCMLLLALSCKNETKPTPETNDFSTIDLKKGIETPLKEMLLSDVAEDVAIIPLATTDDCLFDMNRIDNIVSTEHSLFIGIGKRVLHFDKKGNYVGDIGSFGPAPQDFYYTSGIGYSPTTDEVFVTSNFGTTNELKVYGRDGKFVRKIKFAKDGISLLANKTKRAAREYCMVDGMHIVRRKLPIPNPKEKPWQITIKNMNDEEVARLCDPVVVRNEQMAREMSGGEIAKVGTYWGSEAPVLNLYKGQRTVLFEGNDTVYTLGKQYNKLERRYLMHSGNELSEEEIHRVDKSADYLNECIIVKDFFETRDYLYLTVENGEYAYLLKFDKNTGNIGGIRNKGEIVHSNLMNVTYRKVGEPEFVNDLCGGPAFYPTYHNDREWIDIYSPEELLECWGQTKEQNTLLPEKKEELLKLLQSLKEDDNPVLVVLKLK